MKINKIYISAFGGLKDFTLELQDGLNLIYGNNEDGKSTVSAFIKAMFYGTGKKSQKGIADSIRLKYTPWDNSPMAGRIYFEHQGKRYCLEREFRKSDSTDRITLTDLDSGKAVDTTESVGQQFFGLSAVAFERSLFIGNGDFIKNDDAVSEINAKLSNIALTGSEDISHNKVIKAIYDKRTKLISKSGQSGSYNKDLQAIKELEERLETADNDAKTKALLHEKALEKRAEYEQIYKKYSELKSTLDREQDYQNREKLIEFLQTKKRLDELNAALTLSDGTIINESFTQKLDFGINKYQKHLERSEEISKDIKDIEETIVLQTTESPESLKAQIASLSAEVENLTRQRCDLDKAETEIEKSIAELNEKLAETQNKKTTVNPVISLLSAILAASSGVAAAFSSWIISAVLIAVAAVMLTISFVIKPKNTAAINAIQNDINAQNNKLNENRTGKNLVDGQINNLNARINTLSSLLQADAAVKQQRLADLSQKNDLLLSEQQKLDSAKTELLSLMSGFNEINSIDDIKLKLAELKDKTAQLKDIKLELKTASQFLGNIDYADAEQKLNAMQENVDDEAIDFDAVRNEFEQVSQSLSALKDQITAFATELKTSFRNSENPEELKREIAILQEKADAKKAFCDAADISMQVLTDSHYELRRGYGSELEKATQDIFSRLTDGKYKSVGITDTMDLSVEQAAVFGTRELDYLSLGTTHQAYLSLRLAITTLIGGDEPQPIFLDDALSQYDDTRARNAIAFLKEFCANGQGIFFTCHSHICDIANSNGIATQKPYK